MKNVFFVLVFSMIAMTIVGCEPERSSEELSNG